MQKSPICPDGPLLPALAAGVWRMHEWGQDLTHRRNWIDTCLDLGIDCFDHADIYGGMTCEALFGEVLRESPSRRDRMTLVSKCGIRLPGTSADPAMPPLPHKVYDTTARHIVCSVDNSLMRLGTDWLDILLIHRPDPLMNPDEVAEAFERLHAQGKVRFFGVSNHAPSTVDLLASRLKLPLVTISPPAKKCRATNGVSSTNQALLPRGQARCLSAVRVAHPVCHAQNYVQRNQLLFLQCSE